jgi:hypothetical protein
MKLTEVVSSVNTEWNKYHTTKMVTSCVRGKKDGRKVKTHTYSAQFLGHNKHV